MSDEDARHMRHALALGARGAGRTWPNPHVGCVIVKEGRVVGRGWTADGGRPHAERIALERAGAAAEGATAYISLEPCAHYGATPPCAEALIEARVARVVYAIRDPNPRVDGEGRAKLEAAGIAVTAGVCEADAAEAHKGFFLRVTEGRPRLTLKLAMTLDGRIATASGESRWITGPGARRAVHAMRLTHDAVLVGGGTARADDPTLTVREMGAERQPVRVVASRHLNLPMPSRLSETLNEGPIWLLHGPEAEGSAEARRWTEAGARCLSVASEGGHLNPAAMLRRLGDEGLTSVLCEGGGTLAASLLDAGLVDDLIVFSAGKVLGAEGQPGVGALGVSALTDAPGFTLTELRTVGGDVLQRWIKRA